MHEDLVIEFFPGAIASRLSPVQPLGAPVPFRFCGAFPSDFSHAGNMVLGGLIGHRTEAHSTHSSSLTHPAHLPDQAAG